MGLQLDADLLGMRRGQPYDGIIGVGSDGGRKRRTSTALKEEEDGKEREFTTRPHPNDVKQKRRLACPYRKLDPYRHRDCAK